jgi:beta-glucosidase
MLERSLEELPLRSLAIFSGGKLRWPAVDAILAVLNGRPWELVRVLREASKRRR